MEDLSKKRRFFKLNEDDILEILTEHLAEKYKFDTFQSKAIILGSIEKDLRLIAAIGDLEDDEISKLDLESIDKLIEFNGDH
jgi:hypothetical protein